MVIVLTILSVFVAFASPSSESSKASEGSSAQRDGGSKKSTEMNFDELLIQGKYHFTDEAVTTVEQDKVLDGLLEVRKDFKDRIQQSTTRY